MRTGFTGLTMTNNKDRSESRPLEQLDQTIAAVWMSHCFLSFAIKDVQYDWIPYT